MFLADLVHSEHDTFSCRPLKNTTREQISLYTFEKIRYIIVKIGGYSHKHINKGIPSPFFPALKRAVLKKVAKGSRHARTNNNSSFDSFDMESSSF